jgi:class 3 adenylate cyclase/tetratricopeptide (TPR) repeat protein/ribosomal protein L40E
MCLRSHGPLGTARIVRHVEARVCGECGAENPDRARFCMECGAGLAAGCPSCGAENPPGAKFCMECGTPLAGGGAERAAAPGAPSEAPPEERRKATILFADLSGYTAVAERMDPEAVKSMVEGALRRLGTEVGRYGGTIDKFIGDNVMAVFGAPVSHEDDPERAVRAGLAMQAAMEEINVRVARSVDASFSLRVGINSGEVLAGQMGSGYTVIGDAVNVAARLQAASRPGSVTVGEITWRLTRRAIEYSELEPLTLKGKSQPVKAWEAERVIVSGPTTRGTGGSAHLVGRGDEAALLASLLDRSIREGRPHLVTVMGQAGVGKSRLLRELADRASDHPEHPAVRIGRCPAYGSGLAYWALTEIVRGQFEIADTDDSLTAWGKLVRGVEKLVSTEETGEPADRVAAAMARPLGIEPPDELTGDGENPEQIRDRLFWAVRSVIEAASRQRPLVLAIEDIHWADEGMLDLIEYLARWVRGPALIVCLARDELLDRRPDWGGARLNATNLSIEPLAGEEVRDLVGNLLGDAEFLNGNRGALVAEIAERSGGNPLFAEEMVNRLAEEGVAADAEALPDTVHAVLAARLDALSAPERRIVQHAAVVGQIFWEGSLASLAADEGIDLPPAIASLEEKGLIAPTAGSRLAGEREYSFKHVLIRDVAYSTLPKAVRAREHAAVGAFIEARAADRSEGVAGMVAEHYGRAAVLGEDADLDDEELDVMTRSAIESLTTAGSLAASLYSNLEAVGHYEMALSLRRGMDERTHVEIAEELGDVALRLGRVDRATDLWEKCLAYHRGEEDLPRVGDLHRKIGAALWHKGDREGSIEHYQRGIDLLKDGPPSLELVRLYEEAASLYMHTGDNMLAIYASEKALRLAERLDESAAASRAHGIFGRVFGRIGDTERARENLERSVELARESDPGEAVRALLTLGYHREVSEADYAGAADAYRDALALAERTGDLPSQVELHGSLGQLAVHRGDWAEVERETHASGDLAEREGLTGKLCFPFLMRGWLAWRDGDFDAAEESLRKAAELAEQVGRSEVAFQALYALAATQRQRDDHTAAEDSLVRALDLCERAGLVAQSIEAISARAVVLALSDKPEAASEAADEAERLAGRLRYPVGKAAALNAKGMTEQDPLAGAAALVEARDAWLELGRPLDAARCDYLRGRLLLDVDPDAAREALRGAADSAEKLGVEHLAERARSLV